MVALIHEITLAHFGHDRFRKPVSSFRDHAYTGIMAKKTITSRSKSQPKARAAVPVKRIPKLAKPKLSKPKPIKFKPWTHAEVVEVFSRFRAANPEPKGELEHLNPYTLLVAVALSAQATDVGVNKATRHLFPVADTPEKMVALGEERVRNYIKTIGLYRTKARNVIALSEQLIALHGSKVPHDREALEALPGVGRKTANVVLNIAFGESTIAVDTHLFRVGNRTGLAPGKTPLVVELGLLKIVPPEFARHAHHWLILHGRYTCVARKPRCEVCLINDLCRWPEKTV
ncbi:endonuclease-3 [Afipia massiliensis]|uniref:Endonuclease III n=2 Tax=Afipia massiliensis TaxID=211460 RepID=A0A840N020_9BRAD|nr:endonuclease-3 [Afipia massiliensis]